MRCMVRTIKQEEITPAPEFDTPRERLRIVENAKRRRTLKSGEFFWALVGGRLGKNHRVL